MAEFKKLSDVEVVAEPAESANVLIEEDGVIKKAPKTAVGGAGGGVTSWNDLTDKPFDTIFPYLPGGDPVNTTEWEETEYGLYKTHYKTEETIALPYSDEDIVLRYEQYGSICESRLMCCHSDTKWDYMISEEYALGFKIYGNSDLAESCGLVDACDKSTGSYGDSFAIKCATTYSEETDTIESSITIITSIGTIDTAELIGPVYIYTISTEFLPKATAVEDVTEAPTAEQFNALLAALREAGYLAT